MAENMSSPSQEPHSAPHRRTKISGIVFVLGLSLLIWLGMHFGSPLGEFIIGGEVGEWLGIVAMSMLSGTALGLLVVAVHSLEKRSPPT